MTQDPHLYPHPAAPGPHPGACILADGSQRRGQDHRHRAPAPPRPRVRGPHRHRARHRAPARQDAGRARQPRQAAAQGVRRLRGRTPRWDRHLRGPSAQPGPCGRRPGRSSGPTTSSRCTSTSRSTSRTPGVCSADAAIDPQAGEASPRRDRRPIAGRSPWRLRTADRPGGHHRRCLVLPGAGSTPDLHRAARTGLPRSLSRRGRPRAARTAGADEARCRLPRGHCFGRNPLRFGGVLLRNVGLDIGPCICP